MEPYYPFMLRGLASHLCGVLPRKRVRSEPDGAILLLSSDNEDDGTM